jgi:hypothetical protein
MTGSFGRASRRRAVLFSLGVLSIVLAGCSQSFRQIAIPLPTQTGDPAPLDRALFAASANGLAAGSVTMVDVPGDTNVGVQQVGVDPVMIGLTFGGGRAVVPNSVDNSASSFQTGVPFGTVSTTSLPSGSGANFVGSRQNGKFYITLNSLDSLAVVDFSLSVVKAVPLTGCSGPQAISQVPGGGSVYVGCANGEVVVVTPSDNVVVDNFSVGGNITWLDTSFDGKYTFVGSGSSVTVICSTSDVTVCAGDAQLQTIPVGGAVHFLRYDNHSARVYVSGAGFVSVIDASGIQPVANTTFPVKSVTGLSGNTWVTALADGTRYYVSESGAHDVKAFDATNLNNTTPLATIDLGAGSTPIMIDSDKNSTKVYTANTGSNDFSIIKTLDNTEVLQTAAGVPPRITPPLLPGCTTSTPTCRQTPTWVTVLP